MLPMDQICLRIGYATVAFVGATVLTAGALVALAFLIESFWRVGWAVVVGMSLLSGWTSARLAWRLEMSATISAKLIHAVIAFVGVMAISVGVLFALVVLPVALFSELETGMYLIGTGINLASIVLGTLAAAHAWRRPHTRPQPVVAG